MESYPKTERAILDMWRQWALERKNAAAIMRKSGFRPGATGEAPPTPILSLEGAIRVCFDPDMVFLGASNFAIRGNTVYGWGANGGNQMGRPPGGAAVFLEPTVTAESITDPVWISNDEFGAAVVADDGTVYLSGYPFASSDPFDGFEPLSGLPEIVSSESGPSAFPNTNIHYFLSATGSVWAMGDYLPGTDPLSGPSWYSHPATSSDFGNVFEMPSADVSDVIQMVSGGIRLSFLEAGGAVGTWRYQEAHPHYPTSCPSGVTKLAQGRPLYVLTDSGEIWATGGNSFGERGIGTFSNLGFDSFTQTLGGPYIDVAAASGNGLAVTEDGELYAWGQSGPGLGLGTFASGFNYAEPTQIGTDSDWTNVYGYVDASAPVARKEDGCLYSWGGNAAGQVGVGFLSSGVYEPVQVKISQAFPAWPLV